MKIISSHNFRHRIATPRKKLHWFKSLLHSFDTFEKYNKLLFLPSCILLISFYSIPWLYLDEVNISILLFSFLLIDIAIIFSLPYLRISFAATTSQLITISAPRILLLIGFLILFYFGINSKILLILGMLTGTLLYFWGMLIEPAKIQFTTQKLTSAAISEPIRILHLSDLHIEKISRREEIILDFVIKERPNFIFLTGDFLNLSNIDDPTSQQHLQGFLNKLAQYSTVICSMGSPPVDDRLDLPVTLNLPEVILLRDQILKIQLSTGKNLNIMGVDCDHRQWLDTQVFKHLEQYLDSKDLNILLFHSPEIMPTVKNSNIDLYLCGHTHGGQIRLPFYGAVFTSSITGKKYEKGLYSNGRTHLYVSAGIGLEGRSAPRMRLLCRPEAILWTITPCK
jgi:hypothetical protein